MIDTGEGVPVAKPLCSLVQGTSRLPLSRYMLWRKLTRAMATTSSERTISAAAHAADFADAAHLTLT
jgi:hypothetical protein